MAEFLVTTGISHHLEQLIARADEKIILISPFLKINERLKQIIQDKKKAKVDIHIIYGKKDLQESEDSWLNSITGIQKSFCQNLHAKCYLNEKEAIITSMNLYEFSEVHNREMGILIYKQTDSELYMQIYEEAQRLIGSTSEVQKQIPKENKKTKNGNQEYGFCIRTGIKIPFNIEKPLSSEAYKSWNKYGDIDYPEKYCHFSGEPSDGETTVAKPILKKNWKKAKQIFHLEDLSF